MWTEELLLKSYHIKISDDKNKYRFSTECHSPHITLQIYKYAFCIMLIQIKHRWSFERIT